MCMYVVHAHFTHFSICIHTFYVSACHDVNNLCHDLANMQDYGNIIFAVT